MQKEDEEDCSHHTYLQFFSALGLYLEPLTQHVSAPLPPSFTRPLIAWISCLFNRLIHLLCLFTSFPLTHTFSHPLPPSISLSLCSWAITQTNAVCFPLGPTLRGKIMNGFRRQLRFYFKVIWIISSLWKKWIYGALAMPIYVNSCQISLSSDWPELCVPMRQSLKPNLHHLTIKGEEGGKRLSRRLTSPLRQSSGVCETPTSESDKTCTWRHKSPPEYKWRTRPL